ncbi:MAG: hypothetical protein KF767_13995 [Bdellovibrionaceae bacterium]|nr:hypothetical protein [Pseudobdellovibrionaceae bacterium]
MKSKLTLSLLLVMTAFQPLRSFGQGEPVAPPKESAPKKGTKAKGSSKNASKKRKTPEEIHDEKYEKALGWASKKEADRRRRREALEADAGPSREELILKGQELFRFREWVGSYQPKMEMAPLFPSGGEGVAPDYAALEKEWAEAFPRFQKLQARTVENIGSPRGELEDLELREKVRALYRVSLLRLRLSGAEQVGAWLRTEGETWLRAWTAVAFDESTAEAIRFVSGERQDFARELLAKRRSVIQAGGAFPDEEVAFILRSMQRPWPIDRVFMTEARKTLKPGSQMVANGIAGDLQRLPDRSLAQLRKIRRGGNLPGLAELDRFYTEDDVKLRQREEDLFHELILRCELGRYQKQHGAPAKSLEDLVKAGFLDKIPTNSATGKPWAITQLQQ